MKLAVCLEQMRGSEEASLCLARFYEVWGGDLVENAENMPDVDQSTLEEVATKLDEMSMILRELQAHLEPFHQGIDTFRFELMGFAKVVRAKASLIDVSCKFH